MNLKLTEKARANRNAALTYVDTQKETLIRMTGLRRSEERRAPFPTIGFTSIRGGSADAQAA